MSETRGRILVTGADGNVGRSMVPALVAAGYAVTAFDRTFRHESAADRVLEGDGRDVDAVRGALRDVTQVIHLAGRPGPDHGTQIEVFTDNTALTYTVLQLAADAGIRKAAIASSVQVTGYLLHHHGAHPPYYPIDERTPQSIEDAYPLSKHVDEATLRMICARTGMAGLAIRLPLVASVETLHWAAGDAAEHPERTMLLGGGYLVPEDAGRLAVAFADTDFAGYHVALVAGPRTFAPRPTRELIAQYSPDAEVRTELPGYAVPIDTSVARDLIAFEATGFLEFETQRA